MKLKYYLRGLGTGILFATIILFISYSYKMSDKQIKERASELGMIYPDAEETSSSVISSDDTTLNEQSTEEQTTNQVSSEEKSTEENTTKEETTQKQQKKKRQLKKLLQKIILHRKHMNLQLHQEQHL